MSLWFGATRGAEIGLRDEVSPGGEGRASYLRATDDAREHGARGVIASEASLTPENGAWIWWKGADMVLRTSLKYGAAGERGVACGCLHSGAIVHHKSLYFFFVVHG